MNLLLNWLVLTVSFFNTISLVWLGLMVLLNGNRRSGGTWLTGSGLLLAGLFFTSHTAILGRGLSMVGLSMDLFWWVSWAPAVVAPLVWYWAMLWYAGFRLSRPHPHRAWVIGVLGLAVLVVLLLLFDNPLPTYQYVAGRLLQPTFQIAGIPLLILVYIVFSMACYLLPLDLLRRPYARDAEPSSLSAANRRRALPWLVGASLALSLAGLVLAWTALWAVTTQPVPTLQRPEVERTVLTLDLAVSTLVAIAITLLGRTIVAHEVFTGRALPRHGFFRHWRSTVILALGFGAAAGFTLVVRLQPLYSLMLATALMTVFYALFSWRSFAEREEFMERLRPFVASQDLYDQLANPTGNTPSTAASPQRVDARALFETLCRDVLGARAARLLPAGALSTLAGPPLAFGLENSLESFEDIPLADLAARFPSPSVRILALSEEPNPGWAVSLWNDRGLGGILLLSEKIDGAPYTEEEIEIAQAGGERVLDTLAGAEVARLALDLLRERLAQARVLEGQGRRLLHDEVLPQLHTAILLLSSQPPTQEIREAVEGLSAAHRRISDLIHDAPPTVPLRLAQGGLVAALQGLVETDLPRDFDSVQWEIDPQAEECARQLPPFAVEVAFFAARELLRNAARYGRGDPTRDGEARRPLHLTVTLGSQASETAPGLCLQVEDDGIGLDSSRPPAGSGNGLRFHSAMLAAVGASLEIDSTPGEGTRGKIIFPILPNMSI